MAQVFDFEQQRAKRLKDKHQGFSESDIDQLLATLEGPQVAFTDHKTQQVSWEKSPEYIRQMIKTGEFADLHDLGKTQEAVDELLAAIETTQDWDKKRMGTD